MSIRTGRVSALIKDEIGYIFEKYLQDDISAMLTITNVVMSGDLKNAKIYLSIYNQNGSKEKILNKLNFNKKHIRYLISKRVYLKFLPEIQFYIDDTLDHVEKLEKIFQQIHRDDISR
jgi:ribosome-binding factor A